MIIGIDMGHSLNGAGSGAVGILSEVQENRKIGKRLIEILEEKGYTVVNCTVDSASSVNEQLSGIVRKANSHKLDLFISIHLNSGGGHGTETYVYNSITGATRSRASQINAAVVNSCNFRDRGVKEANFYVLRETIAPAILIEVCFVDSKEDSGKLNTESVARAIFKGITGVEYAPAFKIPEGFDSIQYLINNPDVLKVTEANSTFKAIDHYKEYGHKEGRSWAKPNTNAPCSNPKYRVVCGTYSDKNNAINQQEQLKKAGFDSFLVAIN